MKTFVAGLAAGILVGTPVALAHQEGRPAGGIRIDTPNGVEYLRQFPHDEMTVAFTGPAACRRVAGGNTICRMRFDGLPGQWAIITVRPSPQTAG